MRRSEGYPKAFEEGLDDKEWEALLILWPDAASVLQFPDKCEAVYEPLRRALAGPAPRLLAQVSHASDNEASAGMGVYRARTDPFQMDGILF